MDKNKSIDGLVIRRSKKSTNSFSNTKIPAKNTSKKTTDAKSNQAPQKPHQNTTKPKPKNNQTTKSQTKKSSSIEDFLKPVQAFDFDERSGELKKSQTTTKKTPKKKKNKKPISKKRKIITSILLSIVIILIIAVIWFIIWGCNLLGKITNDGNIFDLFTETYEPLKTDANGRTNILAFGTSGYDMEGSEGNGTHDGAQLTDSIMLISLDQQTGDIAMLSLPRDLKASPTCTATGKINEVYWCNNQDSANEQAGAEALMAEVGDILGVDFQYYAHLNWGSLVQIVNILGGINITLDEDINDAYYTGAVFQAGVEYTIDGGQALGLARARHGTSGGDFSRGASQQKILIGIKDKISQSDLSLMDIVGLANTLGDNLRTDFSVEEIKTAAHLALTLDLNSMRQVSLNEPEKLVTTSNISGISYVIPSAGVGNYANIQSYVVKKISSDPRAYENYSILVLNGTNTNGVASAEEANLEQEGYQNIYTDDAPTISNEKYILYALTDTAPETKKLLEEKYNTTTKSLEELPAGISTAYDFVLILGETPKTE